LSTYLSKINDIFEVLQKQNYTLKKYKFSLGIVSNKEEKSDESVK
jgi:hypothetical protein